MKALNKKIILLATVALFVIYAVSAFAAAQAASNYSLSVSSNNDGVNQAASYTCVITNAANNSTLTNINVTIPAGYSAIANPAITQQPASQSWTITRKESVFYLSPSGQGLSSGQSLTFTFDATNPVVAGNYTWATDASTATSTVQIDDVSFQVNIVTFLPVLAILGIAAGIAFLNTGINRVLINYFIGWAQYRVMQKEMAEFRRESMAAARAQDKKQMEKLKKRQSQINNMQAKMFKPQMLQIGISFVYLIVWFLVLIPVFGTTSLAYLPGIGPLPVVWLYPLLSVFLGLLSQRIIGVMPIEQ
ncbi:MAG: EMC3/TMCO1 family protein [Candidatus Bathyarchaeota archaeon]|nr:EMC3/TMCO1 family protein [Candidatus Bathyarchaeota archaeon]